MSGIEYLLWGLFGGFAVEGLEFAAAIRRSGKWPWKRKSQITPLAASVAIRLAVGSGLAAAAGSAQQISGPFGALAMGVAAPLIIEQLASQITVALPQEGSGAQERFRALGSAISSESQGAEDAG
ncbi:hypothetical protein [Microbispora rosea]|uniref:hypothetical protein n=1 Tax=Microbispora rosea TaxID=58117 RepID=UPI003427CA17